MSSYGKDGSKPLDFTGVVSRTKQSFKDSTSVSAILERHRMTGLLSTAKAKPMFGDFSSVEDYHTSLNRVRGIDAMFSTLPAIVRDRFGNNPSELLAFLGDEKNRSEAESLGLVNRPANVSPVEGSTPTEASATSGTPTSTPT